MPKHNRIEYPVDQIRQWIEVDGKTQQQIADELSQSLDPRITAKLIYKVCKKHGIQCQRTGPRSGEGHPEWKGGRIVNKSGYIEVYTPDHPNARKHTKYILEHRLVMESHLGRYLTKDEVVHHIDGDKQNNDISNLQLFASNGQHLAKTLKGQCPKWTEDGMRRIREGSQNKVMPPQSDQQRQAMSRLTRRRMTIASALGFCELVSNETLSRRLAEYDITLAQAYEMDAQQLKQLVA